jgi:hypothetical protein
MNLPISERFSPTRPIMTKAKQVLTEVVALIKENIAHNRREHYDIPIESTISKD